MKLQDFLIGIGLFGLFTVIIFGAINPSETNSIYGVNSLNATVDSNTTNKINIFRFDIGENTTNDFNIIKDEINDFNTNRSADEEQSEDSMLNEGRKLLMAPQRTFRTISHALGEGSSVIGISSNIKSWIISSFVIIITIIIATAFLRNRLQS